LGTSGAIGGSITAEATGKVNGLLIASGNANVTGNQIANLTVLATGNASVSGNSGGPGITVIGVTLTLQSLITVGVLRIGT